MWKIPWRRAWLSHSSILAWRIPWTEEPGGLQSTGSQRVRHDWSNLTCTHPCTSVSVNSWLPLTEYSHFVYLKTGTWTATCERMKLGHFLTLYAKINWKWIKDLNLRLETIQAQEGNMGITLFEINGSNIFLDLLPKAKEAKAKIKKMGPN